MRDRPQPSRAALLVLALTLLLALGAGLRLQQSSSDDPAAPGNIALAQVVTTVSPDAPAEAPTAAATETETPLPSPTEAATPSATAAETTPAPTPTMVACRHGAFEDEIDVEVEELEDSSGGPRNAIKVCNRKDDRLRIRGRIQLNRMPGDTVRASNESLAWSSCRHCTPLSVAMQVNLISRTASTIAPRNEAFSYNYRCHGCLTVGLAYQFNHQVDNPREVPDNVRRLVREINDELRALQSDQELRALHARDRDAAVRQIDARLNAVLSRYEELKADLNSLRRESSEDDTPGADAG
jgi:hypothetical protein